MSKKLYTLFSAGLFLCLSAAAQYTGGTYTAIMPGSWAGNTPTPIWAGATPPQFCNNCLIQLVPAGGGTILMNSQQVLSGGSTLLVGTGVTLKMVATTATSFNTAGNAGNYVLLTDVANNTLQMQDNTSILDASGLGQYDGIFTSTQINATDYVLTKQFGAAPVQFTNNTITNPGAAVHGTTLAGPSTLSGIGALPIILSSFTASLGKDGVDLAWTTSSEVNADHIAIQRSVDAGAHWSTLATEAAKGSPSTSASYVYTDARPFTGSSEYRLQLVDKDGKFAYSVIKTIHTGLVGAVSIYPNPAHDLVNVTLGGTSAGTMTIRLFNQSGQLLQEKSVNNAAGTTVPLSVSGYSLGNYLLVVTGADGSKHATNLLIAR